MANEGAALGWAQWGVVFLFCAVALGAFGAHGLKAMLEADGGGQLAIWQKAVHYMFIHGFGLLVVAGLFVFPQQAVYWQRAGWAFVVGILLFSGSLILWVLTHQHFLVFLTPLGGSAFLLGWGWLFWGLKQQKQYRA